MIIKRIRRMCKLSMPAWLRVTFCALGLLGTIGSPAHALMVDLNGSVSLNALNGFQSAASRFETLFNDDITVSLDIGFQPLDPGVLAQTSSATAGVAYSAVRSALISDAVSVYDNTAISYLQGGSALSFLTSNASGVAVLDNNMSANNQVLDIPLANAKALGGLGVVGVHDTASADGSIVFNSDFAFDFNPMDGIDAGAFDFVGIATHEIGHAFGFLSGVDGIDLFSGNGPFAFFNFLVDDARVFTVLDLFRYSENSVDNFGGILDLSAGADAFFSIDGGMTPEGLFSTGQFNGDGHQASHWKDNLGLGIMDPTFAPGELAFLSELDIKAFDVIGYNTNPVPVPAAIWFFGSGLVVLIAFVRRRKTISLGDG